ncbi:MAG TPA: hypothetical protein VGX03_11850 [Candidatus Binatia bacterium]|nr:hypothetical protein [Candidatus Binatia bacterium]
MQHYLQQRDGSGEAARLAGELKLRAERRLGELLKETVRPGNPQLSHDTTIGRLPDRVSRDQSSRWQTIAELPDEDFEREIAEKKAPALSFERTAERKRQGPL